MCVVTGTRADWGLLSPVARRLAEEPDIDVDVVATNMHLDPRYGSTVGEIEADGFEVAGRVDMRVEGDDSEVTRVVAMARCMEGMARELNRLRPDALLILGDRYEMLATASAALLMRIPIIHIAGGETSLGAVDDAIRHSITEMATVHLTAAEAFARKVIELGADPAKVYVTGAIGVDNIKRLEVLSREELAAQLGWDPGERETLLVTYHPATLDDADPGERMDALLEALDRFGQMKVLITYPNNDARGAAIIERIERYAAARPGRVLAVPSLGRLRYHSALRHVAAVVGNSSSGLVEVPSMHIPTVDIGMRQKGRLAGESVIHCGDTADEIAAAIGEALSAEGRERARRAANPYEGENPLQTMVKAIRKELFDE